MVITFTHTVWGLISLLYMDPLGPPSLVPLNPLPRSGNSPRSSSCQALPIQAHADPILQSLSGHLCPISGVPKGGPGRWKVSPVHQSPTHPSEMAFWASLFQEPLVGFVVVLFIPRWAETRTQSLKSARQVFYLPLSFLRNFQGFCLGFFFFSFL